MAKSLLDKELPGLYGTYTYVEQQTKYNRSLIAFRDLWYLDEPAFHMPHQCDEWLIGDAEDLKALIADLQAALDLQTEDGDD